MNAKNIFNLGSDSQYMRCLGYFGAKVLIHEESGVLAGLKDMRRVLENEKLAKDVCDEITLWMKKLTEKYPKEDTRIEKEYANSLAKAADSWREKIRKELENIHLLRIEMQSGLNPHELRKIADNLPSEFISAETWKKLTQIEKSDFSDAARCLLLGSATPSVMVALRGAEASIRNYYHCKTKTEPGNKTWRQLTSDLKSRAKDLGIEDTFVGYLDYIGDAKRNFAQHPNKIYSLREAVIVFMQVVGLIEDIYAQI